MPATTSSSSSLGVDMALPPGTSSQMESFRAQELQRRKAKEQSVPTTRRLAPQRKKKTAPTTATAAVKPFHAAAPASANSSNQTVDPILPVNLPIDVSGDDDHIMGVDFEDDDSVAPADEDREGGMGKITANIADWTLHNNNNNQASNKEPQVDQSGNENEDAEEASYHGEIESIASSKDEQNENEGEEEEEDIFNIITDHQVSLNPPPSTTPLVLVNLKSLCGCVPGDEAEKSIMVNQLMDVLLGTTSNKEKEDGVGKDEKDQEDMLGDGVNLEFDERVTELFESNVAQHADSSSPMVATTSSTSKTSINDEAAEQTEEPFNNKSKKGVSPYATIPYPEFLSEQLTNNSQIKTRSTLRLWKLLHTIPITSTTNPQIHDLLSKIFTHLRNTSRSLIWKADMHHQISLLAKREYYLQKQRLQQQEYNDWKMGVRSERLEKLYEVRETFMLRVDVARKKYEALVEEREVRVERELKRRGLDKLRNELLLVKKNDIFLNVGINSSSKGNSVVDGKGNNNDNDGYDDDGWGGTVYEDDILGEDTSVSRNQFGVTPEEEDEEDKNDGEWDPITTTSRVDPMGMNIVLDGNITTSAEDEITSTADDTKKRIAVPTNKLEPISHDDNLKRKLERVQRKQNQLNQPSADNNNKYSKQHHQQEYLKREQTAIGEMLKTNEERIAQATLLKLQERLKNVDDLLESLQEDEWADEEEDDDNDDEMINRGRRDLNQKMKEKDGDSVDHTLLDQILAMILGGLPKKDIHQVPKEKRRTVQLDHYKYIKEEHKSIVKGWISVFGRLPPFPTSEEEPEPAPAESSLDKQVGIDDDGASSMPFGDGFQPSSSGPIMHIGAQTTFTRQYPDKDFSSEIVSGAVVGGSKKDLTLIGNDDSNWDEVEDWDAMFP